MSKSLHFAATIAAAVDSEECLAGLEIRDAAKRFGNSHTLHHIKPRRTGLFCAFKAMRNAHRPRPRRRLHPRRRDNHHCPRKPHAGDQAPKSASQIVIVGLQNLGA